MTPNSDISYPFRGPAIVFFSASLIIVIGIIFMTLNLTPIIERSSSEMSMSGGEIAIEELPKADFGSRISTEISFKGEPPGPDYEMHVYFLDEDDHEEFLDWITTANASGNSDSDTATAAMGKLGELDPFHSEKIIRNHTIDFTLQEESDVYMVIINGESEQRFDVDIDITPSGTTGVCCSVLLVFTIIAVLVMRASFRMKYIPDQIQDNYRYPW